MNRYWRLLLAGLACVACGPALAAATETALDGYLAGLNTWSATFTQSAQDAHGKPAGAGHGRLIIVRPGRLRWESAPEGAVDAVQLLVVDGRNLWFLDRDLDQATVKPLKDAMAQSPMLLLTGGANLRTAFDIKTIGRSDGLDWVRTSPKDAQSDFREARFGFKGRELQRLVIVDKLGQSSTLVFSGVLRNAPLDPQLMQFTLPEGVDLIGTPVP